MSLNSGLYAGVAAVAAQSTNFAIISDNIANVNTVGFKETEGRFRTLVTRSPTPTSYTAGGVRARQKLYRSSRTSGLTAACSCAVYICPAKVCHGFILLLTNLTSLDRTLLQCGR